MRWYLLRDRRHEGPYTKEQIAEGVKAGRIDPRDYLLPENANEDQSSFAYISPSDILGPEFLYDLKKDQASKSPGTDADSLGQIQGSSEISKQDLISQFEDRVESTQLISLKKERTAPDSSSTQASLASFASRPDASIKFPWGIACVLLVALGLGAYFAQPLISSLPSPVLASKTQFPPDQSANQRNIKQNRIPTGRVQLPSTGARDEEPVSASSTKAISEERAEPTKKRRKRKAVNADNTDVVEDPDSASDAETFDEEADVEEDESSEEVVDDADI